jgi:hypothetical protein
MHALGIHAIFDETGKVEPNVALPTVGPFFRGAHRITPSWRELAGVDCRARLAHERTGQWLRARLR